jgi:hypothetical protein
MVKCGEKGNKKTTVCTSCIVCVEEKLSVVIDYHFARASRVFHNFQYTEAISAALSVSLLDKKITVYQFHYCETLISVLTDDHLLLLHQQLQNTKDTI